MRQLQLRNKLNFVFCLCLAATTVCGYTGSVSAHDGATDSSGMENAVSEMTETANRIVTTLDDEQKSECLFAFDDAQRKNWNFVPDKFIQPGGKRLGLVLTKMTTQQRLFTHALLNTVLSNEGYRQTVTIMSLEQVLHELENQNPIRDPQRYYLSIYGQPGEPQWGWRFEGHHLSLNFTIKDGKLISATPSFFGTNPAEVREGKMTGLKTLAAEEALGRELLAALSPAQLKQAVVATDAPADILTGTSKEVNLDDLGADAEVGIAAAKLNEKQKEILQKIVDQYLGSFESKALALTQEQSKIDDETVFVWLGSTEEGKGHYYRVMNQRFLLEYDNTQNNANHVHLVWRDQLSDFGNTDGKASAGPSPLKLHLHLEHQ